MQCSRCAVSPEARAPGIRSGTIENRSHERKSIAPKRRDFLRFLTERSRLPISAPFSCRLMLFVQTSSNHGVWSRFNSQLRLAHFHNTCAAWVVWADWDPPVLSNPPDLMVDDPLSPSDPWNNQPGMLRCRLFKHRLKGKGDHFTRVGDFNVPFRLLIELQP